MKPSVRRKLFLYASVAITVLLMAYLIVPPLVPLEKFRGDFSTALSQKLEDDVEIYGKIRLSLLGSPMISIENIRVGNNRIQTARFRVPWRGLARMSEANIIGSVRLSGMEMSISSLAFPDVKNKMIITNSKIRFGDRDYEVVDAAIEPGRVSANIRTARHRYHIEVRGGNFTVRNPNENLEIIGALVQCGTGVIKASGRLGIESGDINDWFEFKYPVIRGRTRAEMTFDWDGRGHFDFREIEATNGAARFDGRVQAWFENGNLVRRNIRMNVTNAELDLRFIERNMDYLDNANFIVNISGRIRSPFRGFQNLTRLQLRSSSDEPGVINFDTLHAAGPAAVLTVSGLLDNRTAHNMDVRLNDLKNQRTVRCMLNGDMDNWRCDRYQFASQNFSASGTIVVSPDAVRLEFNSPNYRPGIDSVAQLERNLRGRTAAVEFHIGDMVGRANIARGSRRIEYAQKGATLSGLPIKLPLPEEMLSVSGNIAALISNDTVSFSFEAPDWSFSIDDTDRFALNHNNAKTLLKMVSGVQRLPFVKDNMPVLVTGDYRGNIISNIGIEFAGMKLFGQILNNALTLKTDRLDFDSFLDEAWFENFEDNQYLTADPTLAPFDLGHGVAITADKIILNGAEYKDFVYALSGNTQTMSLSDSGEGNLLVSVSRDRMNFKYLAQLNNFHIPGFLLGAASAVNVKGATVTAQAELATSGLTAYDIRQNMAGILDISIDGGELHGLGTDEFYGNAGRMGRQDSEDAVRRMLMGGISEIKEMQIIGEYTGGDFRTTRPFMLTLRHTDITGNAWIRSGVLSARANIFLRGTALVPRPIALNLDGTARSFSISDIMRGIDLDFLREFISGRTRF